MSGVKIDSELGADATAFVEAMSRAQLAVATLSVVICAAEWARARSEVIEASIYPIENPEYRVRLNALADAEMALSAAVRERSAT